MLKLVHACFDSEMGLVSVLNIYCALQRKQLLLPRYDLAQHCDHDSYMFMIIDLIHQCVAVPFYFMDLPRYGLVNAIIMH